jgi:hypothetical protein
MCAVYVRKDAGWAGAAEGFAVLLAQCALDQVPCCVLESCSSGLWQSGGSGRVAVQGSIDQTREA